MTSDDLEKYRQLLLQQQLMYGDLLASSPGDQDLQQSVVYDSLSEPSKGVSSYFKNRKKKKKKKKKDDDLDDEEKKSKT